MSDLELLIETAEKLCGSLDQMANQERRFCLEMQIMFERTSWEIYRHMNDLRQIANFYGA